MVCPGFLSDCLETVDEVGNENRHIFVENGGQQFVLIPCLNDHPAWAKGASEIIVNEAMGWV